MVMNNPSSNTQEPGIKNSEDTRLSLSAFVNRILKAGLALLVFGAVFIVLLKFNVVTDQVIPSFSDPIPFAGGAIVLVALTLLGISLVPAAVAGVAVWWLVQDFFF